MIVEADGKAKTAHKKVVDGGGHLEASARERSGIGREVLIKRVHVIA